MNPLRRVFGLSRRDVWQQLSAEIGGTHVAGAFKGIERSRCFPERGMDLRQK